MSHGDPQKPPSNLVWAILSTVLCFLPVGVVAIVYASQVDAKWERGDRAGAQRASRLAQNWAITAAIIPVAFISAIVAICFLGQSASDKFSTIGSAVDGSTILFPTFWR